MKQGQFYYTELTLSTLDCERIAEVECMNVMYERQLWIIEL